MSLIKPGNMKKRIDSLRKSVGLPPGDKKAMMSDEISGFEQDALTIIRDNSCKEESF